MRELLEEALDLIPRMSDDDPIAPALRDWLDRVVEFLRSENAQKDSNS